MHKIWGAIVAGVLFVPPSLFILIGLCWVYLRFGDVPVVAGIFDGIKPAVAAAQAVLIDVRRAAVFDKATTMTAGARW